MMIAYLASQDVAACGTPHNTSEEVGKKDREYEDEDSRYYAGDVGYELGEDLGDLLDAQGVGGHRDGYDEDEPENKLAQDGSRGLAGLGPLEELFDATALHPAVEAYGL